MKYAGITFVVLIVQLIALVTANPPIESGVITNLMVYPSTARPGQRVTIHWKYPHGSKAHALSIFIGHSTGMGHAPVTHVSL
jgi:hypothetical protein